MKGINFKTHEVQAIQRGDKVQVSRVIKPQPPDHWKDRDIPIIAGMWGNGSWRYTQDVPPSGVVLGIGFPPHQPGDVLYVKHKHWISDCGQYYAVPAWDARHGGGASSVDIYTIDGSQCWLSGRYKPTGFDDTDRRYTHNEFPHMITDWSNLGRQRGGKWITAFKVGFADVDTETPIQVFTGNTIINSYEATFHKQHPSIHMPQWAARYHVVCNSVNAELIDGVWYWVEEYERTEDPQ